MNSTLFRAAVLGGLLLTSSVTFAQALNPANDPNAVIASRGGVSLTMGEVDAKIRTMPEDLRAGYLTEADRVARFLDTMLLTKQMAIEAEKAELHKRPNFAADLDLVRQELLARQLGEEHLANVKMPNFEQLAHERYLAAPEKHRTPARIDLRHILISTDGKTDEAAKQAAADAFKRASAGEDFVQLVMELSDEKSKDTRQGLIQEVDLTKLDEDFARAAAALGKAGAISQPVRSKYGYHVIKMERLDPPQQMAFEDVKHGMIKELREQFVSSEKSRYLSSYSQQQTDLNNELIRSLPERYTAKPEQQAAQK